MSDVIAGVDAGGTKTTAALCVDGQEVSRVVAAGGALRPGRVLAAAAVIADAARRALASAGRLTADVLVVGTAGAGRDGPREELRAALHSERLASRLHITTDIELKLVAGFDDGPGIVLAAGTGSIAVARAADGTLWRSGGYGWQLGDEGSGYAIGRAALGAVGRAHDGRGPATVLSERILAGARVAGFDELVGWAGRAGPTEVAALARVVLEAAGDGDAVAAAVVDEAAAHLAELVTSLLRRMDEPADVPVALAGSLLITGPVLKDRLLARLAGEPRLKVVAAPIDPVLGAFRIGRRMIG